MTAIRFVAPLPPAALRGNSRAHWRGRKEAADAYSEAVAHAWRWTSPAHEDRAGMLYEGAVSVVYEWRYAGAKPDLDNIARGIKVLQDTLCAGPEHARFGDYGGRWFLGLFADDGQIEPVTFRRRKVAHKADEGVEVTIEREDA